MCEERVGCAKRVGREKIDSVGHQGLKAVTLGPSFLPPLLFSQHNEQQLIPQLNAMVFILKLTHHQNSVHVQVAGRSIEAIV